MDRKTVERIARAIYDTIGDKDAYKGAWDIDTRCVIDGVVDFEKCAKAAIAAYVGGDNGAESQSPTKIAILEIPAPDYCEECPIISADLDRVPKCTITGTEHGDYLNTRHPDCPLLILPEHGDPTPCDELKPCPFCGGEAIIGTRIRPAGEVSEQAECTGCYAAIDMPLGTRKETIAAWNGRV